MAGRSRLWRAQDGNQITHAHFSVLEQMKNPKAGAIGECAE
jgi:hypothetical protein